MRDRNKWRQAVAGACLAWITLLGLPALASEPLPSDTAVAIYFRDEVTGKTRGYLFYDINSPFQMSMCKARLTYLTKMFYRMTRTNPDLKDKTAVASDCVKIKGFDFGER